MCLNGFISMKDNLLNCVYNCKYIEQNICIYLCYNPKSAHLHKKKRKKYIVKSIIQNL